MKLYIDEIKNYEGQEIALKAWLYNKRSSGKLHFLQLRDGTGEIQAVIFKGNVSDEVFDIADNITLEILNSYYYTNEAETENDYSVCTLVKHYYDEANENNFRSFIFTGDLEHEGEEYLISMNNLPKVDLYKAGHHGSKTSSTEEFLKVIQPKTVCVCCCAGSPEYTKTPENQFPTQEFINNIAKYTTYIYVTTLCVDYQNDEYTSFNGNIVYTSNSLGYNIKCSNNSTILKESDWFKQNRTWPA